MPILTLIIIMIRFDQMSGETNQSIWSNWPVVIIAHYKQIATNAMIITHYNL